MSVTAAECSIVRCLDCGRDAEGISTPKQPPGRYTIFGKCFECERAAVAQIFTDAMATTPERRNFDCEDIVGYCECGGPIYAESIGTGGDNALCVPCRRDAARDRL